MSDAVLISIINGIVTIAGLITTLLVKNKLEKVHKQVNGKMDDLVSINRKDAKAEGFIEGVASEKVLSNQ